MNCIHGFEKDVEPPVKGMHRCSCCGLNGRNIYIQAGAKWPRADPLCQDCREAEDKLKAGGNLITKSVSLSSRNL